MIEGYHDGEVHCEGLAERFKILLATSRVAKAIETATNNGLFLRNLQDIGAVIYNEKCNYSVVGTYAHVHNYIKMHYIKENESTYFWRNFDFVVIDEFHAITTDSSYADCAVTLYCLIMKIYRDYQAGNCKTKIILLSATPQPSEWLCERVNAQVFDFRNKIKSLKPPKINVLRYASAEKQIMTRLKQKETVVYYMTLFDNFSRLIKCAIDEGISEEEIAVSVSDEEIKKRLAKIYPRIYENIDIFENGLSSDKQISSKFKFIITNSRCKEAINITNKIDLLVMESHYSIDVEQICGRFRNGIKDAWLISDAHQFRYQDKFLEEPEYIKGLLDYDNYQLKQRLTKSECLYSSVLSNKNASRFISELLKQSMYRAYDMLTEQFVLNIPYIKCKKIYEEDVQKTEHAFLRTKTNSFFNGTPIVYEQVLDAYSYIEQWFREKHLKINVDILSGVQFNDLMAHLRQSMHLLENAPKKEYKHDKLVLEAFGASYKLLGKKTKKENCKYQVAVSQPSPLENSNALHRVKHFEESA